MSYKSKNEMHFLAIVTTCDKQPEFNQKKMKEQSHLIKEKH